MRLLALESHRHRAIVIGEDLGTLPEGFHGRMEKAGILGMKVLWFEQEQDGRFRDPRHWPRNATAMTTTHAPADGGRLVAGPRHHLAGRARPLPGCRHGEAGRHQA
ncbi:4-alpha-glucanotransferase [Dankookia sp. P2]|uniref:4-alpha-glucanotransferase n=1 Tax=Dankookia sp. P2 TaxID=3423955 RepID=UPI003D67D1D1